MSNKIRLKKGQVDPKNPHATSVAGPTSLRIADASSVNIKSSRVLQQAEEILDVTQQKALDDRATYESKMKQNADERASALSKLKGISGSMSLDEQVSKYGPYLAASTLQAQVDYGVDGREWDNEDNSDETKRGLYESMVIALAAIKESEKQGVIKLERDDAYYVDDLIRNMKNKDGSPNYDSVLSYESIGGNTVVYYPSSSLNYVAELGINTSKANPSVVKNVNSLVESELDNSSIIQPLKTNLRKGFLSGLFGD